jgi:hypothetical protein
VRATEIIPARDPLYIPTTREPASHSESSETQHYSMTNWGIQCTCKGSACKGKKGTRLSLAPWHKDLLKFLKKDNYQSRSYLSDAVSFLQQVDLSESYKTHYRGYPSFELRRRMVVGYLKAPQKDANCIEALKTLLSMVFVVGPTQVNYVSRYELLDTLSNLCSVLARLYRDDELSSQRDLLPYEALDDPLLFLRHLHCEGSSIWHGAKSELARISRQNLDQTKSIIQNTYDEDGKPSTVVAWMKHDTFI